MTIGTINGVNIYKITQQEVPCNPSAFQSKSQFWVEGDHKSELSEDEINYLKDKFHSSNMTGGQDIDFLGELVQMGVLSKDNARNIYYGFAPLDMSKETMGKSQGKLEVYDEKKHVPFSYNEGSVIGGMNQAVNLRGFDYYKTLFEYVKNTSTVNQEESTYFKDYQNYLMILERLQKE